MTNPEPRWYCVDERVQLAPQYDGWNVYLVCYAYIPRWDMFSYFQFPLDCQ